MTKLWLDDERPCPEGWVAVKTAHEAIKILETGVVVELSLDHDLGDPEIVGTGYDVLCFLETRLNLIGDAYFIPHTIHIHTANSSARIKMQSALNTIKKMIANIDYEQT